MGLPCGHALRHNILWLDSQLRQWEARSSRRLHSLNRYAAASEAQPRGLPGGILLGLKLFVSFRRLQFVQNMNASVEFRHVQGLSRSLRGGCRAARTAWTSAISALHESVQSNIRISGNGGAATRKNTR